MNTRAPVPIADVKPGTSRAEDLRDAAGALLRPAGYVLAEADLENLLRRGIETLCIVTPGDSAEDIIRFARRFDGLWVDAGGPAPMVLDGWTAYGGFEYEGGMSRPGQPDREATHSRDRAVNGLLREE